MLNKRVRKGEKGITIVSLVITMIVLIILATISLNAVKTKGLIKNAQDISAKYSSDRIKEDINVIRGKALIKGDNVLRYRILKEELDSFYGNNGYEITPKKDSPTWIVTVGNVTVTIEGGIEDEDPDDYEELELTPSNAYMIGYQKNTMTDINIPGKFTYGGKNYKITSLGEDLFSHDSKVKRVTVPDTVVTIKESVLAHSSVEYLYLGKGLKSINGSNVLIWTFYMKEIEVSSDNTAYKSEDGVLFTKNGNSLIFYPASKEGSSYTVPNGVKTINDSAFALSNLTTIILPNTLKYIGYNAFYDSEITSLTVPNSVKVIEDAAFNECDSLTSLTLSNNISEIKEYTFSETRNLTQLTIPASVKKIESHAFSFGNVNLTFENYRNISELEDYAFSNARVNDTTAKNYLLTLNSKAFSEEPYGLSMSPSHYFYEILDY